MFKSYYTRPQEIIDGARESVKNQLLNGMSTFENTHVIDESGVLARVGKSFPYDLRFALTREHNDKVMHLLGASLHEREKYGIRSPRYTEEELDSVYTNRLHSLTFAINYDINQEANRRSDIEKHFAETVMLDLVQMTQIPVQIDYALAD